jgi:2-polyprenyl-6-methoxyphenol hydroxylase-like FAD-dependent oxidoreductase
MAGLWTARVLADHFEQVTVVERDRYPSGPDPRKGGPQARHVHVLLARGQQALDQLFPMLDAELAAHHAVAVDWGYDCLSYFGGSQTPRLRTGLVTRTCSRDLIEWAMRQRLATEAQVRFVEAREAVGLVADTAGTGVVGVRLKPFGGALAADAREETLTADLVVDASGRNSQASQWLVELGYDKPSETTINSFLGYASRVYQRPANGPDWLALLLTSQAPTHPRGGVIYPIEGDRWLVTLGGTAHNYPPTDEQGFDEFAGSLVSPVLSEAIRHAQPLSPIRGYRRTENRRYDFEQLKRWPERFVVIGDAVCAFNPVYGQGMTVSALSALELDHCLRTHAQGNSLAGLSSRFQHKLASVIATPWLMSTGEDFRWPTTEGGRPDLATRLFQRYIDQLFPLMVSVPVVKQILQEVTHLVSPPTALFHPGIVLRVLQQVASGRMQ